MLPQGWVARQYIPARSFAGFGTIDVHVKGAPETRQQPLEFSIVGVDGDTVFDYVSTLTGGYAEEGNVLFAAQVVGFELDLDALEQAELPFGLDDLPVDFDPRKLIPSSGNSADRHRLCRCRRLSRSLCQPSQCWA